MLTLLFMWFKTFGLYSTAYNSLVNLSNTSLFHNFLDVKRPFTIPFLQLVQDDNTCKENNKKYN